MGLIKSRDVKFLKELNNEDNDPIEDQTDLLDDLIYSDEQSSNEATEKLSNNEPIEEQFGNEPTNLGVLPSQTLSDHKSPKAPPSYLNGYYKENSLGVNGLLKKKYKADGSAKKFIEKLVAKMDAKAAFRGGELKETIYMTQPEDR
ncbi:hypothetical protein EJ110_NYTH09813 [Nymphaea thermarum]|nr:hypothetical protein EJ110_NYTH09813 [Nymphaea thermarum]